MRRRQRHRLRTGNEGWLTSYADLLTNLLIFFVLIVAASEIQTGRLERIASRISVSATGIGSAAGSLSEAQKILEKTVRDENLAERVNVRMTDSGLELSFNSGVTFASGRAEILPEMIEPLERVLAPLVPYATKYRFAVEGHTDSVPISATAGSPYRSNWDLSSARSLEVRERLERIGVPRARIRVEAYADTKPLEAELIRNLSSMDALARARRVVVRLY